MGGACPVAQRVMIGPISIRKGVLGASRGDVLSRIVTTLGHVVSIDEESLNET